MDAKLNEPKIPDLPIRRVEEWGLKELERIRLILRGGSVIEWRRMHLKSWDEADRFLRLCLIDPGDPVDQAWARTVLADAVEYLRKTFKYRVNEAVANPKEIHDLFLYASGVKEPSRNRKIACIVLKLMHVIQHIEGRELLYRLAASEAELQELITQKVMGVLEEMAGKGLAVREHVHSLKARDSIVTKLLAKKETLAAQVYDRTRFRIVTETRRDILPVLYFLTQRLIPFNFVVPTQTENNLITFKDLLHEFPHLEGYEEQLHLRVDYEQRRRRGNRFSGRGYRALNFVADVPARLDRYLPPPGQDTRSRKNRIGFLPVEFQIVDADTALRNEQGENSHERYKERQRKQVLRRLSRGLVVPRRMERPKARKEGPL